MVSDGQSSDGVAVAVGQKATESGGWFVLSCLLMSVRGEGSTEAREAGEILLVSGWEQPLDSASIVPSQDRAGPALGALWLGPWPHRPIGARAVGRCRTERVPYSSVSTLDRWLPLWGPQRERRAEREGLVLDVVMKRAIGAGEGLKTSTTRQAAASRARPGRCHVVWGAPGPPSTAIHPIHPSIHPITSSHCGIRPSSCPRSRRRPRPSHLSAQDPTNHARPGRTRKACRAVIQYVPMPHRLVCPATSPPCYTGPVVVEKANQPGHARSVPATAPRVGRGGVGSRLEPGMPNRYPLGTMCLDESHARAAVLCRGATG